MKIGPWQTAWFCVSCKERLIRYEKFNSHGRCPKCGVKYPMACSIVETFERAYRVHTLSPWWNFWNPKTKIEYKDDENKT